MHNHSRTPAHTSVFGDGLRRYHRVRQRMKVRTSRVIFSMRLALQLKTKVAQEERGCWSANALAKREAVLDPAAVSTRRLYVMVHRAMLHRCP